MKIVETFFDREVKLIQFDPVIDERGEFVCFFDKREYKSLLFPRENEKFFVRDYLSYSVPNVLRGLHYHINPARGKLITLVGGLVYDVFVDIRKSSPTFGKWEMIEWYSEDNTQLWIPPGFAHGFYVDTPYSAVMIYKMTNYYQEGNRKVIRWNDPDLAIDWPCDNPILNEKDRNGQLLSDTIGYK